MRSPGVPWILPAEAGRSTPSRVPCPAPGPASTIRPGKPVHMSHTYRLEVGTRWLNQWTTRRCEVVAIEQYAVTVKMLDPPFEEKHFPADHPLLAIRYNNLAHIELASGNREKACAHWHHALSILLKHFDETHPNVKVVLNALETHWGGAD